MSRKMAFQDTSNRYIHWYVGDELQAWVYNDALFINFPYNKIMTIWSRNPDLTQANYELFALKDTIKCSWENQLNRVFIPKDMFSIRMTVKKER